MDNDERIWAAATNATCEPHGSLGNSLHRSLIRNATPCQNRGSLTPVSSCSEEHYSENGSTVQGEQVLESSALFADVSSTVAQQQACVKPCNCLQIAEVVVPDNIIEDGEPSSAESQVTFTQNVASMLSKLWAQAFSSKQCDTDAHQGAACVGVLGNATSPSCITLASSDQCDSRMWVPLPSRMHNMLNRIDTLPDMIAPSSPDAWPTYTAAFRKIDVHDAAEDERTWLAPKCK